MYVKAVITIVQRTMFVNRKSVQLVVVIRMLIGLIDIFAKHTKQKARKHESKCKGIEKNRGVLSKL